MNEKVLIQELQNIEKKEVAFRSLVLNYQKMLYYHIRRMVGNHDDTDDILQNTFILAWRNIEKFRGDASLKTWLYRIATNETITFINNRNKRAYSDVEVLENQIVHSTNAHSDISGDEIQQKLKKAIALLPDKQRLVFNMRYYEEMSFKEISEILNITEGGLKANYHHAAKKIEQFLTNGQWDTSPFTDIVPS